MSEPADPEHEADVPRIRADARRNHDAVIEAAVVVFAASGVDAPVKLVADRAGVGIGPVYRRFPKRSDLIIAVMRHEIDECAGAADLLAGRHEPFQALALWTQRYLDLIITKRGLSDALNSGDPAYQAVPAYFEGRLVPSLQKLIDGAAGQLQVVVTAADLLRSVPLLCAPAKLGGIAQARRMVAVLVNGLRMPELIVQDPGMPISVAGDGQKPPLSRAL